MSDLDESGVTYREISSTFEDFPDIGSPGVVGPEHDGLPWMPPSPDYMPGPEEPQSPPPLDYVLELVYPEFNSQNDELFSPLRSPPLPSDPKADPEEDDDEDPEEDPVDYPADGGDDGDDEDEPSDDDKDEEVDIKADDEEEEEHQAPADSTAVALPAID
ncbi:hypothetical protein Tco_1352653 [Tanacetum coccineum]